MSSKDFIKFLQDILSVLDKNDSNSVSKAKLLVESMVEFLLSTGKIGNINSRLMVNALRSFDKLVEHSEDFKGVPGDYLNNQKKRERLFDCLQPGCHTHECTYY